MLEQGVKKPEVNISELFSQIRKENEDVSKLDPLNLDEFFHTEFIQLINSNNIDSLKEKLNSCVGFESADNYDIKAYLRDVGMIMAALRKLEPQFKPEVNLENKLLRFAKLVNEPPRDSIFSYGPRNPGESRKRMFIGSEQEQLFIASFSEGMKGLDSCLENLLLCYDTTSFEEMEKHINQAVTSFEMMVDAIVMVRRKIKPEYFTNEMRPFFDPIIIGGESFSAPGGAQMPILIIDVIMWSKSLGKNYLEYVAENFRYIPDDYEKIFGYAKSLESLDKYILSKRNVSGNSDEQMKKVFTALKKMMDRMISFRVPHFKVAEDNFKLRQGGAVGSGGYTPELLVMILDETKKYRELVSKYESRT